MNEFISINHKIQKYIIDLLIEQEVVRFSELRPPRVDTNLFSYHLKKLIASDMIVKRDEGYTLGIAGLAYANQVVAKNFRPNVAIVFLIQNGDGDVLLQRINKQPFINAWTLPYGEVNGEDANLECAAQRQASEKLGLKDQPLKHAGDCYVRVKSEGKVLSTTLAHVFKFNSDDIVTNDTIAWARPHKLNQYRLALGVEEIMTRGFFNDPFFFEEFEVEWPSEDSR